MLKREGKILVVIFSFLISQLVYHFTPSLSQLSCSQCRVENCECSIPENLGFKPLFFGVYSSSDCSGKPLFYWMISDSKIVWKPENSGNYYVRLFSEVRASDCFSIKIEELDNTPPMTNLQIVEVGDGNYNLIFSCKDDKSGCDKTYYCVDTSNVCNPTIDVSGNVFQACRSCCFVRYYSTDKAGNKESMKSAPFGKTCKCVMMNPSLDAAPPSQKGKAGERKNYIIRITNNDNAPCGSSTFGVSVTCLKNFECSLDSTEKSINPQQTSSVNLAITPSSEVKPGKYKFRIDVTNLVDPRKHSSIEVEYEVVREMWEARFIVEKGREEIRVDRDMELIVMIGEPVKLIVETNFDLRKKSEEDGVRYFLFIETKEGNEWKRVKSCSDGNRCEFIPERTMKTYRGSLVVLQNDIFLNLWTSAELALIFSDWSITLDWEPKGRDLDEEETAKINITLNKNLEGGRYIVLLERKEEEESWGTKAIIEKQGKEFSYEVSHENGRFCYVGEIRARVNNVEKVYARSNEVCLRWVGNEVRIVLEPEKNTYFLNQPIKINVVGYAANQITVWIRSEGYNFWAISPSKTFGPEERINWSLEISSGYEIGNVCIYASYLSHLTRRTKETKRKCFSIKGKPRWVLRLAADKTNALLGEEVIFKLDLCEDEACKQPFPLLSPYTAYLIDFTIEGGSEYINDVISPTGSCTGNTFCWFRVRSDAEKIRTFYAIVSDEERRDIRGRSNEITVRWEKKVEKKLPNLVIGDIKIVDGVVFYKVNNSGNEKTPPTCSALLVQSSSEEDGTKVILDYVDGLETGEERWEAFDEVESLNALRALPSAYCRGNEVRIEVEVNKDSCDQWGLQGVEEAERSDNKRYVVIKCDAFCREYESMKDGRCSCDDRKCNDWCQVEGKKGECKGEKCECLGVTNSDLFVSGLWYTEKSWGSGLDAWWCYGNNGYNTTHPSCFNLKIYKGGEKVFPSTPGFQVCNTPHGVFCSQLSGFKVEKDATYEVVIYPMQDIDTDKDNNKWTGRPSNFLDYLSKSLSSCIPTFVYGKSGEVKRILPKRGCPHIIHPAVFGNYFVVTNLPEGRKEDVAFTIPLYTISEIRLECKRPVSGKFKVCSHLRRDICTEEMEFSCLSSPPIGKFQPFFSPTVTCSLSVEKESRCSFNLECEKGLWVILSRDKALQFPPIVQSTFPYLTLPPFTFNTRGKVKIIAVCYKPRVEIFSSLFDVS